MSDEIDFIDASGMASSAGVTIEVGEDRRGTMELTGPEETDAVTNDEAYHIRIWASQSRQDLEVSGYVRAEELERLVE